MKFVEIYLENVMRILTFSVYRKLITEIQWRKENYFISNFEKSIHSTDNNKHIFYNMEHIYLKVINLIKCILF